ncbi:MAG: general secretion pathway protein GspE [Planctomycetaceae bacterium]|nr:general secretion pathway protein GspE [Planctomycetaceae bacterium]
MDFYKEWLGIPEGERPPNHYELLRCVRFEDDPDKIRAHYKKLNGHVRKYATGQYSVQSQELLNELAKAMLCLTDPNRKRDYDESLGREFPPETDEFGRQPMLDILVRQGDLSRDQRGEAEQFAERRGLSHRDAVVQMKLIPPRKAAQALSQELGYSYVDLEDMIPEDDVLDMVPRSLVKEHSFVPLFIDDGNLLIACVDQPEPELEEELRLRYEVPVRPVIATPRAVNQAIAQYYAPGMRDEATTATPTTSKGGKSSGKSGKDKKEKDTRTFAQLTPEEQKERKNLGILMMCWSIILPMFPALLWNIAPQLYVRLPSVIGYLPYTVVIVAPATIWYVLKRYWK